MTLPRTPLARFANRDHASPWPAREKPYALECICCTAAYVVALTLPAPLRAAIVLPLALLVPGWLTLSLIDRRYPPGLRKLCHGFGLSIIELVGLCALLDILCNLFQSPVFLSSPAVCGVTLCMTVGLFAGAIYKSRERGVAPSIRPFTPRLGKLRLRHLLVLLPLPLLTVAGAIQLNNGAESILPVLVLAYVASLFVVLLVRKGDWPSWFYAMTVLVSAACLVLQFSLRSSYLFGSDMHQEFMVFSLTLQHGYWYPGNYESLYNSCLSLSLLPMALKALSGLGSYDIFKVVMPVLISASAVVCFAFARIFVSERRSLLASLFFISFPSFTMVLVQALRGGVALVFFGLFALAYFDDRLSKRSTALLLSLTGVALVLSHYSSAYLFITILVMWKLLGGYVVNRRLRVPDRVVTWRLIFLILIATCVWQVGINRATDGLKSFLSYSVRNDGSFFSQRASTNDANVLGQFGLGEYQGAGPQSELDTYLRSEAQTTPSLRGVTLAAVPDPTVPLLVPMWTAKSVYLVAQLMSKLLKMALLIAPLFFACLMYVRRSAQNLPRDLTTLAVACCLAVVGVAIVPGASIAYSTGRTYQMALIGMVVPLILLLENAIKIAKIPRFLIVVPFIVFFLLYSGFLFRATGGQSQGIYASLWNGGVAYDTQYENASEYHAAMWLSQTARYGVVVGDDTMRNKLFDFGIMRGLSSEAIVVPLSKNNTSYVIEGTADVRGIGYAYVNGETIRYIFPDVGATKARIYSSGGAAVYK